MIRRNKVLWIGEAPTADVMTEFKNRELLVEFPKVDNISNDLFVGGCGIVYNFCQSSLTTTREVFSATWSMACNHGLQVYLLADDSGIQAHISTVVDVIPVRIRNTFIRRTAPIPSHEIAERAARYDPGPAFNENVSITLESGSSLNPEGMVLLKRAFYDCDSLVLRSMTGGYSASVFLVNARFLDSIVGPRPLPFFVKLDKAEKVEREKNNYREYTSHYIPFNLRPNLDDIRCLSGAELGILVGNFVERSEPLWDVVRRGQAQVALNSLFDDALWGWRSQAFYSKQPVYERTIADGLSQEFDYRKVKPIYLEIARGQFKVYAEPIQLWEHLLGLKNQRYREGPMHGDLHGNNVRVRGGDAIVIDFYSTQRGPLVADLANLETWISFEKPPECRDENANKVWMSTIDLLYPSTAFSEALAPLAEPSALDWLWDCVRQLRSMAATVKVCSTEYESAIAVYLLRRTMYDPADDLDKLRRAYAYVVAARLIEDLRAK